MASLNLIALRASEPSVLKIFYELLGVGFEEERHGNGPTHYSATFGGVVLEICPKHPDDAPTSGVVIGFSVKNLDGTLACLMMADGVVISTPVAVRGGRQAIIEDPAGHRVILLEEDQASITATGSP